MRRKRTVVGVGTRRCGSAGNTVMRDAQPYRNTLRLEVFARFADVPRSGVNHKLHLSFTPDRGVICGDSERRTSMIELCCN